MDFAPLRWVTGTVTIWHLIAWVAFFVICIWPVSDPSKAMPWHLRLWSAVVILPVMYCWMGPIVGQIFGDKFVWSQLWPSGLAIAAVFSMFFLVALGGAAWDERSLALALLAIPMWLFASMFFGLFFAATSWVMPRVVDAGLVELPKPSWGVKLPPSP